MRMLLCSVECCSLLMRYFDRFLLNVKQQHGDCAKSTALDVVTVSNDHWDNMEPKRSTEIR